MSARPFMRAIAPAIICSTGFAGEDVLHPIEAAELGDISGKRVLHLQCHIGLECRTASGTRGIN
jgi:hypothetical protein